MDRKIIVSLAPVKAGTLVDRAALAEDVQRCVELGAGMCHLHCRRPDGSLTPDTAEFVATFEDILARTDVVVQASTGGVSDMTIEQRCNPLDYWRVESASLNGGTTNLNGGVYVNTDADIDYCARRVYERGIIPLGVPREGTGNREQGTGIVAANPAFPFRGFERPENCPVDSSQREGAGRPPDECDRMPRFIPDGTCISIPDIL